MINIIASRLFHLLLYSKYGEKMDSDETSTYEGFLMLTRPENHDSVLGRASRLGSVLSEKIDGSHGYVMALVKPYLSGELLSPLKALEVPYYKQYHDNVEGD